MKFITPCITKKNTFPDGPFINLDHLKTIESDYLNLIVDGSWGIISLNGLEKITPDIALIFGRHKGILSLNSIISLDYESALYLAKHEGTLFLKGLKTLDNSVIELFSMANETIILGLESVNDKVAHILARSHGVIGYSTKVAEQVRVLVEGI